MTWRGGGGGGGAPTLVCGYVCLWAGLILVEIGQFVPHSDLDVNSVCQDGCGGLGVGGVALSNSVTTADGPRLTRGGGDLCKGSDRLEHLAAIQRGQLVLCKVFVGQTAEHKASADPTAMAYPNVSCVFRQMSPPSSASVKSESQQREWFAFDHELVLPEFIIHFEYTSQV